MKLGCSSWSYNAAFREQRTDMREWLRVCAEDLEVDGVELVDLHFATTDPVYLRDLKKLCVDLHLSISGVAVNSDFGSDDRRFAECEKVKQWCDVAAYLGAPIVRVFAGWFPLQRTEPEPGWIVGTFRRVFGQPQPNTRRIWSDVTWALRQCADYAAERGVVLALQNSGPNGLAGTPSQLAQLVHDVGSPWLRVCLDPADLKDRAGIDSPLAQVVQTHARLGDLREDGSDPATYWPEVLQMLRLAKYRGFVHIDYQGDEPPESAVPRAVHYLRNLMQIVDRQRLLPAQTTEPSSSVTPAQNGSTAADVVRGAFEAGTPARR